MVTINPNFVYVTVKSHLTFAIRAMTYNRHRNWLSWRGSESQRKRILETHLQRKECGGGHIL